MSNLYIEKGGKKLRCGYTTGSCAAAAAKAALLMLLGERDIKTVSITTPKGIVYIAEVVDAMTDDGMKKASCAVIKDGGDDPDVTDGMKIYAEVALNDLGLITIEGGIGIGRVTKPGLDQPVGEAAINSVPRKMIRENIEAVLRENGLEGKGASVTISAPKGSETAQKTFNPKLGIIGGISILGTTGIVEPMSDAAIVDTIKAELNMHRAAGENAVIISPGNYGLKFLKDKYGIEENRAVMSSNFIYDTVKMASDMGFDEILLVGHLGKLVKVSGGIKNTHSAYGDHRMEIIDGLVQLFCKEDERESLSAKINECVMTDSAVSIIEEAGLKDKVFKELAARIKFYITEWSDGRLRAETIVFSNENTLLVSTDGAKEILMKLKGAG